MGNRYFFQYLLNEGVLSSEDAKNLLPKLSEIKPSQSVLDLVKGRTKAVPGRDACLMQLLLDEGKLDYAALESRLADYKEKSERENPVVTAVMRRADNNEDHPEFDVFAKYAEMFIMSVHRFVDTEAVILHEVPEVPKEGWLVSQSLNGGVILTAGVKATEAEFLELGQRFSGEELTEIDELAVDCVAEFLNVLNGLYIVNLSQLDMDVDLGEPRSAENVLPEAKGLQAFTVATEFGSFLLCMADSEFIY